MADSAAAPDLPSLIATDEPAPFSHFNVEGSARVLIVCDHASPNIPRRMDQLGLADWVLERHIASDIGAADVARVLARLLDAPAVFAGYSRLIVDLNRGVNDPSAFPHISDGIAIQANQALSDAERVQRITAFYDPYHAAIDERLRTLARQGITPAVIAVHTCTPVFADVVRQWHVGVMWDKDPRIPVPLMAALKARGDISIGDNEPYSGQDEHDFTLDHHAEGQRLPYVGIEIRQDLVDDEVKAAHWAGILAEALSPILAQDELYRPFTSGG